MTRTDRFTLAVAPRGLLLVSLLSSIICDTCAIGKVSVNLKQTGRTLLDHLLPPSEQKSQPSSSRRTHDKRQAGDSEPFSVKLEDFLKVEFSGDFLCHVVGRTQEEERRSVELDYDADEQESAGPSPSTTAALIRLKSHIWPNVFVGGTYDLSKSWLGVSRIRTTLRWLPQQWRRRKSRLLPDYLDVCGERNVLDQRDRAAEVSLRWQDDDHHSARVFARVEPSSRSCVSLRLPVHRRLVYEYQVNVDPVSASMLPNPTVNFKEGSAHRPTDASYWWMPEVTLKATGQIEAMNEAVFAHPLQHKDRRISFRLVATRAAPQLFDGTTHCCLTLQDTGKRSTIGVKVHAELERPLESVRLAVRQQQNRKSWSDLVLQS